MGVGGGSELQGWGTDAPKGKASLLFHPALHTPPAHQPYLSHAHPGGKV